MEPMEQQQQHQHDLVLFTSILADSAVPLETSLQNLIQLLSESITSLERENGQPPSRHVAVTVSHVLAVKATFLSIPTDRRLQYGDEIADRVCFPVVCRQQSTEGRDHVRHGDLMAVNAAQLFCSVAEYCSDKMLRSSFTRLMETLTEAGQDEDRLSRTVCFLHHILSQRVTTERLKQVEFLFDQLFTSVLGVLRSAGRTTCYHISSLVLPSLLDGCQQRVRTLWEFICHVWDGKAVVELGSEDLVLTLLCSLSGIFISTENDSSATSSVNSSNSSASAESCLDVRVEGVFWSIVQTGLASNDDPLSRKRCLFLLDKVLRSCDMVREVNVVSTGGVFWWNKQCETELRKVWANVTLLMETLEEKQVHIVKPVLQQHLRPTIAATMSRHGECGILHVSWVMVIMKRLFVHDARSVTRSGLQECLCMQLDDSPFLQPENWEILLSPLLDVLCQTFVFAREDHHTPGGEFPPIVGHLVDFIKGFTYRLPLEQQSSFVTLVLRGCVCRNMADVPLVYVAYAISQLRSNGDAPLINSDGLTIIRKLLLTNQLAHQPKQRSAILCFILSAVSRQGDKSISYSELLLTLGCFCGSHCLVYGSSAWNQACCWLVDMIETQQTVHNNCCMSLRTFLQDNINKMLRGGGGGGGGGQYDPSSLATLLLLGVDTEHERDTSVLSGKEGEQLQDVLTHLLGPVAETIAGARLRAYMSSDVVRSAVSFLSSLLKLFLSTQQLHVRVRELIDQEKGGVGHMLYVCLKPWLPDMFTFLYESLLCGTGLVARYSSSLDHVQLFSSSLDTMYQFMMVCGYPFTASRDISLEQLANSASEQVLSCVARKKVVTITAQLHGAVTLLQWVCRTHIESKALLKQLAKLPADLSITKPSYDDKMPSDMLKESEEVGEHCVEWGPAITHCLNGYWNCILYTLSWLHGRKEEEESGELAGTAEDGQVTVGTRDIGKLVTVCMDYFDIAGHDLATPLQCVSLLIPKLMLEVEGLEQLVSCVETAWPLVFELKGDMKSFTAALKAYLCVCFHPMLMLSQDEQVHDLLAEYTGKILELGEMKAGPVNLLVGHICGVWRSLLTSATADQQAIVDSMCMYADTILLPACVFGPIFKKNLRISATVEHFIASLGDKCSTNQIVWSVSVGSDHDVRICVLSFLVEMAESFQVFVTGFLPVFVSKLSDQLVSLSIDKPHYFVNTRTHRVRQRMLQVLLLLQKWMDKSTGCLVATAMLECLENDQQLSVRFYMEWLTTLILSTHTQLVESLLLPQLKMDTGRRLSRLCSIFTIAMLIGESLQEKDKPPYYLEVLPAVFQWCLCHHFIARVYAAGAVVRMCKACQQLNLHQDNARIASIINFVPFIEQYSDVTCTKKLETNILFSLGSPTADVSIQVIFQLLPALVGVMEEELISVEQFVAAGFVWQRPHPPVALYCHNEKLLEAYGAIRSGDAGSENLTKFRPDELKELGSSVTGSDVQKKIMPWSSVVDVERELFPNMSHHSPAGVGLAEERGGKTRNKLILIASLLSKASNLGGLCRTCEIFGVHEYAVSSTAVLEEKQFQSLSVTSEKWQKITEVKPSHLKEYLQQLRERGYALVGVEQTAHSKCLSSYPLPLHTALLLGSEREGIPVDLIHMLDTCVEIPQLGIIRSLNVHVSGALVVWEYMKQHALP